MAIAALPLFLPLIPGLIDAIIEAVEKFTDEPGTPEEQKAALAKVVADCRELNARIQDAPLPGDEVPPV